MKVKSTTVYSTGKYPITVSWKCSKCGFDNRQNIYLSYGGHETVKGRASSSDKNWMAQSASIFANFDLREKLKRLERINKWNRRTFDYHRLGINPACSKCSHKELWTRSQNTGISYTPPHLLLLLTLPVFFVLMGTESGTERSGLMIALFALSLVCNVLFYVFRSKIDQKREMNFLTKRSKLEDENFPVIEFKKLDDVKLK